MSTDTHSATSPTLQCNFLYDNPCREAGFGIIRAEVPDAPTAFHAFHWVFTLDQSGSMGDICNDGKTKIQHIRQTVTHIVDYLHELSKEGQIHYLTLVGFNHAAQEICSMRVVEEHLVCEMPRLLAQLKPSGTTSFSAALGATDAALGRRGPSDLDIPVAYVQRVNVFMTDGHITSDCKDIAGLKLLYEHHQTPHIFVGCGDDHDAPMLRNLADVPKGGYYFIESVENAGLVYGEIVHSCLHELLQNIDISVTNGEVYNFQTNKWEGSLHVPSLVAGKTRVWQVRATNEPGDPVPTVTMTYNDLRSSGDSLSPPADRSISSRLNTMFGTATSDYSRPATSPRPKTMVPLTPRRQTIHADIKFPTPDVEKYWWRQRTQELLARARTLLEQKRQLNNTSQRYCGAVVPIPTHSREIERDANLLLDAAKSGSWSIVRLILEKNPTLINVCPHPRRFCAIHHAIHQRNDVELHMLLSKGANPAAKTRDGLTCTQLCEQNDEHWGICLKYLRDFQPAADAQTLRENSKTLRKDLDSFLADLTAHMENNDLKNDPFLQTLSDDIYVCLLGLNSHLGDMFVNARISSQGTERAYNMQRIDRLQETCTDRATRGCRGAGGLMARSSTTCYATNGDLRAMRSCSGSDVGPPANSLPPSAQPPHETSQGLQRQ